MKIGKHGPLAERAHQIGESHHDAAPAFAGEMCAEAIGRDRAGRHDDGLDDQQRDRAPAERVGGYEEEQHGLDVEGHQ